MLGTPTATNSVRSDRFGAGRAPNPAELALVLLRSPKASEGQGGALGERVALERGNTVGVRDQIMDLVADQGLPVSRVDAALLPTPSVAHLRNHDEPIEGYLERRQDYLDGKTKGMPGASLGVAVRMELMPTPNTMDGLPARTPEKIAESKKRTPAGYSNLRETVVNDLFPTPTTQDGKNTAGPSQMGRNTLPLNAEVTLLGTPRTSSANAATDRQIDAGAPKARLEDQAVGVARGTISWGKYEPAIRRWEQVIGREAPAPTKPDGKDGAHRLSSSFTEWMMGLPEGWITGAGLKRNQELKACGNGVVPQQAELALRVLLSGIDLNPLD